MALHKDKELRALAEELSALDVFSSLPPRAVEALAAAGRTVHLPSGWALMSENTPADSVYVLLAGTTEVRHGAEVIATLGAGALVGEAALVSRKRRNATVITAGEVRALRWNYDDLAPLITKHHDIEQLFTSEWDKKAAAETSF
jgi:CRP/FNR family cyclic AMP-dependent transcriptional regulator